MTEKEAIDILIAHAVCCYGELSCLDYCPFYYDGLMHCDGWNNEKVIEAVQILTDKRITVETNMYDKEEIYPDCTVQVLTNTATGEVSVGWWKNGS